MRLNLKIWKQYNRQTSGRMIDYVVENISPDMSFLEMLDELNQDLIHRGDELIEFDNDCREGICGMCSLVINGIAHGPKTGTATCQLHMRSFNDGDTITIEPWRASAFPVIKDLVVDRSAFDRIIATGGYVSVNVGNAPDGNAIPIPKEVAESLTTILPYYRYPNEYPNHVRLIPVFGCLNRLSPEVRPSDESMA